MKFRRNIMEFKHLKLFGACSVATLLFCFDVNGVDLRQALINIGIRENNPEFVRIANTPIHQLRNGVIISETKKEDPKNNNTFNSSKNERRNTVRKVGKSSVVSEQEFAQWIGKFEENLVDPEELHFFSNSANYICQLVEQGANIRRNGVNYSNQCPILALNLDEDTMLRVYDEMDKFNDYGHNFANYMRGNGGLSDGDQKTWSRISNIIKHRVAIYTRHSDSLVCTIYGENKELPVKRVYLKPNHYQELLMKKKPNAGTSEQRNREEQSRETESPKQEKKKTVEDVRKEFIDAINSKKKQGEKRIDTLKKIFENSGLTKNEELKKEMNLFESIFGESLHKFKSDWKDKWSPLMREVSEKLKENFYNEDNSLKDGSELQGKESLVSDLSEKVAKLENALSEMKKDVFGPWFDKVEESSVNEGVKKVLRSKLGERETWLGRNQGEVSEYRAMLRLISQRISESSISYKNPTFEQAKKFTKEECEEAIKSGVIRSEPLKLEDKDTYFLFINAVESKGGNVIKSERLLYGKALRSLWDHPVIGKLLKNEWVQRDIIDKVRGSFSDLSDIKDESFGKALGGRIPSNWFTKRDDLEKFYKIIVDRLGLSIGSMGNSGEYYKYLNLENADFSTGIRALIANNSQLFRDPDFVRGLKDLFSQVEQTSKNASTYTDGVKAMFEVISRL